MKLVYVSWPISVPEKELEKWQWVAYRDQIDMLASQVALAGFAPVVPVPLWSVPYDQCLALDKEIILKCDVLLAVPQGYKSRGVTAEILFAGRNNIPIVRSIKELEVWKKRDGAS